MITMEGAASDPSQKYELPAVVVDKSQDAYRIAPLLKAPKSRDANAPNEGKTLEAELSVGGIGGWAGAPNSPAPQEEQEEEEFEFVQYSCYAFDKDSAIRKACLAMVQHPMFDQVSMAVICLNCVTLALYDPLDPDCETTRCQVVTGFDISFTLFFFVEMLIKIIAVGMWGNENAYVSDAWNRMDGTIAIIGMLDLLPFMDTAVVKAFRAVRPLRAVNRFPELRVLIKLLLNTLPMLASVALLCFFIFFVFGILAVQLWKGVLRQRCFDPTGTVFYDPNDENSLSTDIPTGWEPWICTRESEQQSGVNTCAPTGSAFTSYYTCAENMADSHNANPFWGSIHFDNIFGAWIAIFQCITLEAWVDIMYMVQSGYSFHAWIYFVTLVVVGAFFAVNLTLVVISAQFAATRAAELDALGTDLEAEKEAARIEFLENFGLKTRGWWSVISSCGSRTRHYIDNRLQAIGQKALALHREAALLEPTDPRRLELEAEEKAVISEAEEVEEPEEQDPSKLTGCAKWQMLVKLLVISDDFNNGIMVVIVANVGMMATEHHGQPDAMSDALSVLNVIFCAIFLIEMILKLIGLTPAGYFRDGFNMFDCVIVVLSTLELFMGSSSGLSVLRTFRLIRVFKLVRFLPSLQHQLAVMLNTLTEILSFLVLLFLFMFIFAILGMFLFGNKFVFDGEPSRKNFDTFVWAITTVFQILTQEDWNIVMYHGVRACGFGYVLYFVLLLVMGNYILFNLFVAILIDGFGGDEEAEAEGEEGEVEGRAAGLRRRLSMLPVAQAAGVQPTSRSESRTASRRPSQQQESEVKQRWKHDTHVEDSDLASMQQVGNGAGTGHEEEGGESDTAVTALSLPHSLEATPTDETRGGTLMDGSDDPTVDPNTCTGGRDLALGCWAVDDFPRSALLKLVTTKWFDNFIMFVIALNSIALAWERPNICDGSVERHILDAAAYVFNAIFLLECIFKTIAFGFWWGPNAYIKDGWNKLDFFIVVVSVVDFVFTTAQIEGGSILGLLKIFRMLRALRPLRAVNKMPGLKKVVNTMIESIVPIGSTLLIVLAFFLIFGILGVQLLSGKLYRCEANDNVTQAQIDASVVTRADCAALGGDWNNTKYNYDHLGEALMTLFVLSSIDGWVDIMYEGIDAVGVDKQPIVNYNEAMILFYIIFLLVGGFFILNMFVGVIVENFQKQQEIYAAEAALVKQEELAAEQAEVENDDGPPFYEAYGPFRRATYDMCVSTLFETIIAGVIIANIVVMASEHWNPSSEFEMFLKVTNILFTVIFIFESGAKLIGFGIQRFFCSSQQSCGWNNFDLFVVLVSVLGIVMDELGDGLLPVNPTLLRLLRILRIARILKLLKSAKDLMTLLETVKRSLAQVGNLALLLFLLFFIFAALGIELFGRIECSDSNPCDGFDNDLANFQNFGMAMLVLFRLSTGDNWNGMLKDTLRTTGTQCADDASELCQMGCYQSMSVTIAPIYFVTFVLVAQFVMLNLVVAVLMQELESSAEDSDTSPRHSDARVAPEMDSDLRSDDDVIESKNDLVPVQDTDAESPVGEAVVESPLQMMQTGQTISPEPGKRRDLPRELPPI